MVCFTMEVSLILSPLGRAISHFAMFNRMFTYSNFAYDIEGSGWCQMAFNVILIYSEAKSETYLVSKSFR